MNISNITLNDVKDNSFAQACYDQNTVFELIEGLYARKADETDCKTWGITPTEYRKKILIALTCKVKDLIETEK